jgi:protein TonB
MAIRKTPKADLRSKHGIYVQAGMILALSMLIVAFRVNLENESEFQIEMVEQEVVQMEEIPQTEQVEKPPPPPRPPVPVEVPDDEVLEDDDLDLDAMLDLDEEIVDLPPPPPDVVEEEEPEIFVIVEDMPTMIPDNTQGMINLQRSITYPEIAKKAGVEGRVIVQFVVDEQGNVRDPVVVRGIGAGCDEEAIKAVLDVKFRPGRQRGQPVQVKMSLPITFRLR